MSLTLPYDPSGLDPRTAMALDELVASLQTWFNKGKIEATSYGTFNQPRCRYFLQSNQSVANNTDTAVLWSSLQVVPGDTVLAAVQYDNGSTFGASFLRATNTDYLVPPVPGQYLAIGGGSYAANATGRRDLWLQQRDDRGATFDIAGATSVHSNAAGAVTNLQVSAIVTIQSGQFFNPGLRLMTYQNSGGALNLNSGFSGTYLQMIKLS